MAQVPLPTPQKAVPRRTNALVQKAAAICREAHGDQRRKFSGAPYAIHPERVAKRVSELPGTNEVDVAAAWLHDVLEDTDYPAERLEAEVGPEVLGLVQELTDPSHGPEWRHKKRKEKRAADRAHLVGVSERARRIKLVDILDNVRDLDGAPRDFQEMYLAESRHLLGLLRSADEELGREVAAALDELQRSLRPGR